MGYAGISAKIPLGTLALNTDDDPGKAPPGSLIRAQNVQVRKNFIETDPGSRKYMNVPVTGRLLTVTKDVANNTTPWTTSSAHLLADGMAVFLTTTGTLPRAGSVSNFIVNTLYYVVSSTTLTFQLAATVGGAALQGSSFQSGVHSLHVPSGVTGIHDWWPDDVNQRLIAVNRMGLVYRIDHNGYKQQEITGTPANLNAGQPYFVQGGAETLAASRKLFLCTGTNQVQVITADGMTRVNISLPAADWATSKYPTHGINYGGRLWLVSGNNLYGSSPTNHEDFTTIGAYVLFNVFPGDAQEIRGLAVWKGRLHIFKYPTGLFYLDDTDPTTANWAIRKLSSAFGGGQLHCAIPAVDDLFVANETGGISSMKASQALGGVETGDLMNMMRCEDFTRTTTKRSEDGQAVYYGDRKQALFTYRSVGGTQVDRICRVDLNQGTRVTWLDKDQPNCIALMKDFNRVERPIYGAEDGFVYVMDQEDRDVGGVAYTADFQTSYLDMGHIDLKYSEMNKNFDFLQVTFSPTGEWNLSVDVFIDDRFIETIQFQTVQTRAMTLGDAGASPLASGITLGDSGAPTISDGYTEGELSYPLMKPLHGNGKRISLRCYNAGLRQKVRVSALTVYFRPSGQEEEKE